MTTTIQFRKMHGLGNDFMIVDGRQQNFIPDPDTIRRWGDRRRGIGFDQFIFLRAPASNDADVIMDIYNTDGSIAGACGNATRCVADIVMKETGSDTCIIQTVSGFLNCSRRGALIAVDMGVPALDWADIPLARACDTANLPIDGAPVGVSMGNPHCVFFVDDVNGVDLPMRGPGIEKDPLFPKYTNVEFVQVLAPDHLRMRVWERGSGITQACGTGACATLVAAVRRGLSARAATVTLDGGDLHIVWDEKNDRVTMTGPVAYVYEGQAAL